jgi:DNA-binding NarL/FixJ family response regulator
MRSRVLIVNRCQLIRTGLRTALNAEPDLWICGEAETWEEARHLSRTQRPELAILDLEIRQGSRFGLLERLKIERPELKILVCGGLDDSFFAERCVRAGALGYVRDDQPIQALLSAVRRVLAGKIHLSEAIVERTVNGLVDGARHATGCVESLSNRELDVFTLMGEGLGAVAIADQLCLSVKTVDSHRENIKRKLGLSSAKEVICRAVHWSLTSDLLAS